MSQAKPHIGVCVVGHVDAGKCQGFNTPILMYDGSIKMIQNIVIGDELMGDDSTPRTVLDTTKGHGPMYRITQSKGMSYTANDKHLLSLKICENKFLEHYKKDGSLGDVVDISVTDFMKLENEFKKSLKGFTCKLENYQSTDYTPYETEIYIESIGDDDYYGFELDGNGRYLMSDFTVTHNSTTTGHLLFKLGEIDNRELEKMTKLAQEMNKGSFNFAFFLDVEKNARERGITVKSNSKEFKTENYHYTIVDCPGHRDFLRNFYTGSSTAEVAILMIPAELGGFEKAIAKGDRSNNEVEGQTRQHARIINLIGIKQVICCVNKMDDPSVNFSESRFNEIKDEAIRMLASAGYGGGKTDKVKETIPFIPISGLKGLNLFGDKCSDMPWYTGFDITVGDGENKKNVKGHTLYDALNDFVQVPKRDDTKPLRMPVSDILSIKGVGDIITGRIEQGTVKPGDNVVFIPSGASGTVFSVEMHHKSQPQAVSGDNVGLNIKKLDKARMPKKGDIMMLTTEKNIYDVYEFTAQIVVQDHPGELKSAVDNGSGEKRGGFTPSIMVRTAHAACQMYNINWKLGKSTNKQKVENPPFIQQGDSAEVVFRPQKPLYLETYDQCEGLARICIMDSNSMIALGKVTKVTYATPELKAKLAAEAKARAEAKKAAALKKK